MDMTNLEYHSGQLFFSPQHFRKNIIILTEDCLYSKMKTTKLKAKLWKIIFLFQPCRHKCGTLLNEGFKKKKREKNPNDCSQI